MGESYQPLPQTYSILFFWLPKQGKGREVEIRVEMGKTKMRPWKT